MAFLYLLLAVLGTIVPYARFLPWLFQHGLDVPLFFHELLATRIGEFFGADVLLSAVTLILFIRRDTSNVALRWRCLAIAATCLVGVSCGLPLFLYFREIRRPSP